MFSAILRRLSRRSLRARLTFWYLLTLGATLSLFGAGLLLLRSRAAFETLDADLQVRAHRLAEDLRQDLFSLDIGDALASDPRARARRRCRCALSAGVTIFRSPAFPELTWSGEGDAMAAARAHGGERTIEDRNRQSFRLTTLDVAPPSGRTGSFSRSRRRESVVKAGRSRSSRCCSARRSCSCWPSPAGAVKPSGAARARAVDSIVARVRDIQGAPPGERLDVRADSDELDRLITTPGTRCSIA